MLEAANERVHFRFIGQSEKHVPVPFRLQSHFENALNHGSSCACAPR